MRHCLLVLALIATLTAPASALIPPWYYIHAQLRATLEGGPIRVLEIEQVDGRDHDARAGWVIPVALVGPDAWEVNDALATVFNRTYLDGLVRVEVRLPGGARGVRSTQRVDGVATAIRTLSKAFTGNPNVAGVFAHNGGVVVELKPQLIQFYADDINDRHGLAHLMPATCFEPFIDFSPFTGVRIWYSYAPR